MKLNKKTKKKLDNKINTLLEYLAEYKEPVVGETRKERRKEFLVKSLPVLKEMQTIMEYEFAYISVKDQRQDYVNHILNKGNTDYERVQACLGGLMVALVHNKDKYFSIFLLTPAILHFYKKYKENK